MTSKNHINIDKIPQTVAIIMDGNGRWATLRGLDRCEGHIAGAKAVREVVEASREIGIKHLVLYAFSIENWKRPKEEVDALMALLVKSLHNELSLMMNNDIRLRVIGDLSIMDPHTRGELELTLEKTKKNKSMDLVLALSYGSKWELTQATKMIVEEVQRGELKVEDISEDTVAKHLQTSFMPDPDLLIRTSGEARISNFLLWQLAYTEFFFTPVLWPDFTKDLFFTAIVDFQQRERRFGKITAQISSHE